jgi:hypothetical protein
MCMDWFEINNKDDAQNLLIKFGGFHDGCLKELKYISGEYVYKELSMMAVNSLRKLSIIFQRQWENPSAIEMIFEGLVRINLVPSIPNNDGIIYDAYFDVVDNLIYWAETNEFNISEIDSNPYYRQITWIIAEKARWRIANEYIGDEEVYINRI